VESSLGVLPGNERLVGRNLIPVVAGISSISSASESRYFQVPQG